MRNLMISYCCNANGSLVFGNFIQSFEEFPNILDIEQTISNENNDSTNITILNIKELNDEDFNKFIK